MTQSPRIVFDLLVSLSLFMPHMIKTVVHDLVEPMRVPLHIGDGSLEVVWDMMLLLQMIGHVKWDLWMHFGSKLYASISHGLAMTFMDMVHLRALYSSGYYPS